MHRRAGVHLKNFFLVPSYAAVAHAEHLPDFPVSESPQKKLKDASPTFCEPYDILYLINNFRIDTK